MRSATWSAGCSAIAYRASLKGRGPWFKPTYPHPAQRQRPPKSVVSDASTTFIRRVDGARGWCCRVIGRVFGAHPGGLLEPGDVSLKRFAPIRGQPEPGPRPAADRPFPDFDVASVFQEPRLLREHRVTDPRGVAQRGELDPVRAAGEQAADRQPGNRVNDRIQPGGRLALGSHIAPLPVSRSRRMPRRWPSQQTVPARVASTPTTIAAASSPCSSKSPSTPEAARIPPTIAIVQPRPDGYCQVRMPTSTPLTRARAYCSRRNTTMTSRMPPMPAPVR